MSKANSRKPIRVFYSTLSQRFYASRAYKQIQEGVVELTGEKFDVTDDIAAMVLEHEIVFSKESATDAGRRRAMEEV